MVRLPTLGQQEVAFNRAKSQVKQRMRENVENMATNARNLAASAKKVVQINQDLNRGEEEFRDSRRDFEQRAATQHPEEGKRPKGGKSGEGEKGKKKEAEAAAAALSSPSSSPSPAPAQGSGAEGPARIPAEPALAATKATATKKGDNKDSRSKKRAVVPATNSDNSAVESTGEKTVRRSGRTRKKVRGTGSG
jgi:hypothetical protein